MIKRADSTKEIFNQGWLVVHARDKKSGNWRLRDSVNHPIDPYWERGNYICCHPDFRKAAKKGDIIFDLVYPKGIHEPTVIRSAFIICAKDEEKDLLHFEKYYFADGDPIRVQQLRNYKSITGEEASQLLNDLHNSHSYGIYTAGDRPKSVSKKEWSRLKSKARIALERMKQEVLDDRDQAS